MIQLLEPLEQNLGGNFGNNMALNLSAFGINNIEGLNLSAFGISPTATPVGPAVKTPTPSFSDIVGLQDMRTAQTTPAMPSPDDVGMARLPFAKEPSVIPGGKIPALAVSLFTSLPEAIIKSGVRALAQAKESGFLAKGEATPAGYQIKPEPIDLSFGDLGKRIGFDSNKIQTVGNSFMEDFTKRQQANPNDLTDKTFFKNFGISYGKEVILPILDAFAAGSIATSLAKIGLKATLRDPITQFALKEMRITPSEATDKEVLRYAFNRQWETIIGRGGTKEELNRLGQATEHLYNKVLGGEDIKGLDKLGEIVQKISRTFLSDMSLVTNRLPMGLSIEDISKQLPAKIKEAAKLVEQIKQAGGDIGKAQGIVNEITKATSLSVADNLLGQIKTMAEPITQEAQKYKSAEDFVKAQGEPVYHGTPNAFDKFEMSRVGERGRTEGRGFYFTDNKSIAEQAYTSIPGGGGKSKTGRVIEAYLDIKKPMAVNQHKITDSQLRQFLNEIETVKPDALVDYGGVDEAIKLFRSSGSSDLDILSELGNVNVLEHQKLNNIFTKITGYDGIIKIEKDGKIFVAFNPDQIKTKSQLTDIWNKANKKSFIDTARKISNEDLKLLAEKFKNKDLTQAKFEELVLEAEFAQQMIEANAAKELAKYSPRKGKFAGELKEVTGKKGGGIFAKIGDQIVTQFGFESSEKARESFNVYRKQREQLNKIQKQITELRKTKAAIGKGEKLMKLAIGDRRTRLRTLKDRYNLTDAELAEIKDKRNITAMSKSEFDNFIDKAEQVAQKMEGIREARISLLSAIHEKNLRKWENIQQAMKLPPINKMTAEQMNQLNEILSQYKNADEFLTTRQLETIGQTELKGMRTTREVLEHLAKRYNLSVADLPGIKPHPWMYDAQLARQHPLYDLLVDKYNVSYLKATGRIIELEKEINGLIKASRKFQLVPTDKNIIKWLEATMEERTAIKLSSDEMKAAQKMDEIFKEYYDWLIKRASDKKFSSRFEDKYFPHTRRGFLEAWKEDGFLKGVKEAFDQFKQEERMMTILDEKTGEILPYQKWVGFAQFRTNKLVPTQNAAKAFKTYITALEKARQFDEFIPEIMIYVHSLTPKELTSKGLKMNNALQRFVKTWINSKKGRVQKQIVTPGGRMDWALRMGVAITRIKDLGVNIPIGIANIFGEQAGNLTMLRLKYPIGVARLVTPKGQAITKKYENFIGKTFWDKFTEASNTAGDQLLGGMFGMFGVASRKGNQIFLLGSMTPEEFAKGEISIERLAYLRKKQGKYRVVEGAESVFGKSAEAAVGGQYKKWAIPIIVSTKDNAFKLASILRNKGIKAALSSEEGAELFFSVVLGSVVGLGIMGYYNELKDKKDRNFVEDVVYKSTRDALSMIGALDPRFLASFSAPRLASFIVDLGEALDNLIMMEKYKTTGELKGVKQFKQTLTPAFTRPFFREEKKLKGGIYLPSIKIPSYKIPSIKL